MNLKKKAKIWKVLYKEKKSKNWIELGGEKGYWYADPILLNYKDEKYLFTEAFNMKKQIGYLAVSKYENSKFSIPKVIMKRMFHLSYPCVFEYSDSIYMIPETGQNGTLELWKCDNDIYTWKKICVLKKNIRLADSTILIKNKKIYIFSYEESKNFITHIYELDINNRKINEIQTIVNEFNNKRPAGKFFEKDGNLYRPVQKNINKYGESILINQINSINPFIEENVDELTATQLTSGKYTENTHTLSIDDELEIIDTIDNVELSFVYRNIYIRKIRNLIYKIKYKIISKVI